MAGEVKQLEFSDGETVATPTDTTPTSSFDPGTTNLIINGAMNFWQREIDSGINTGLTDYFSIDRYCMEAAGSGVVFNSSRTTDVPTTNFKYSHKLELLGATAGSILFHHQRVEADDIRPYIGKSMTLQFWIKGSAARDYDIEVLVPTGGEDTWEADQNVTRDTISFSSTETLSTSWTLETLTFTVPAGASDGIMVGFFTANLLVGDIIRTTGWMLYEGAAATGFKPAGRNQQDELAMCERFYRKSYALSTVPGTATSTGVVLWNTLFSNDSGSNDMAFPVRMGTSMRVAPTVVLYTRTTGASGLVDLIKPTFSGNGTHAATANSQSFRGFYVLAQNVATTTAGFQFQYTADAEL